MEDVLTCPVCHTAVRPTDYYCFNCGKNLHPKPPSVTIGSQLQLYLGSLLLPPLGLVWGIKYLVQPDGKSKTVGLVAIIITVIELFVIVRLTVDLINTVNNQVNQQLEMFQGF